MSMQMPLRPGFPPGFKFGVVNSPNLPHLLGELGVSFLASTYEVGRLAVISAQEGQLKAAFAEFRGAMGIDVDSGRLAVGTQRQLFVYHDVRALARLSELAPASDAIFMPRWSHVIGNSFMHEVAWAGPELWFVSARFSCLCTLNRRFSFVPRWCPPFITAIAPDNRCHLNGLEMVGGQPKYVTAHGQSDEPGGWRSDRAHSGILMDVPSGEVLLRGLAMPHSPRVYDGKLWVLDSGRGTLSLVHEASGKYETVAELPGFTRGLDFAGHYAFVGLSQVRQSGVFHGIPLVEGNRDRTCGVWIVDLRSGKTAAWLRFDEPIREIFGVKVLHGLRSPQVVQDDALIADFFVLPNPERDRGGVKLVRAPSVVPTDPPAVASRKP
jgi:uncharacterized protein (TIGR03032 family)